MIWGFVWGIEGFGKQCCTLVYTYIEGSRLRVQSEEGLGPRLIWSGLGFAVSGARTSRRAETCKVIGLCGLVALCV